MSSFRTPQIIIGKLPGHYEGPKWIDGTELAPVTILASVQPASAGDYDTLEALLEGRRIEAAIRIYTSSKLVVASEGLAGDTLIWDMEPGNRYTVTARSPWQSHVIPHYRYLAIRELEK